MSILSPDHLFGQAERLIAPPPAGPPRQVDLRRAISSAYYGVFHFINGAVADEFVGASLRATPRYGLTYRAMDHRSLRDTCNALGSPTPSQRFRSYLPAGGFSATMQTFATAVLELQQKRHQADYDPLPRFQTSEARLVIGSARSAVRRFADSSQEERKTFLTLLICPPRSSS